MILDYLFRSLRGRFTVLAVVGFTLGLTAVALVGAAFMESAMKQEAEKSARGLLLQYANDIRADISRTSAVLQGVSHAAEAVAATDKPNRDLLGDILDRCVVQALAVDCLDGLKLRAEHSDFTEGAVRFNTKVDVFQAPAPDKKLHVGIAHRHREAQQPLEETHLVGLELHAIPMVEAEGFQLGKVHLRNVIVAVFQEGVHKNNLVYLQTAIAKPIQVRGEDQTVGATQDKVRIVNHLQEEASLVVVRHGGIKLRKIFALRPLGEYLGAHDTREIEEGYSLSHIEVCSCLDGEKRLDLLQ